ncbi:MULTISPECIES: NAD(P)H-dependent glycerol-3-phosphate dehydrogenase [unclassified Candidatus Cardinium]|uniref:NAD(P)H-dependent glycerol-3-phosphate dehydrogenase n=1 Tax=unclassified Candidatus Cardinium TaxID=2641185 RepID=UPI001FB499DC|nr:MULTISPECIES: NAD(P)H-dependent glycerol-3-phosphate dehydrogenase [unclassified Candidatus Cardinium]
MDSKQFLPNKVVTVLGAGKFGTAVANLLSPHVSRLFLYTHKAERAVASQTSRSVADQSLAPNIVVTNDLTIALSAASVIFPVVPAAKFRGLMQQIASYLRPDQICIHGTKGLDVSDHAPLTWGHLFTMSKVIVQETPVRKVGCLAGPNLSGELAQKYPAVTVVASASSEVLALGEQLLSNDWFRVYPSHDLLSVEMCSVLKNIFAIGAGIIGGMGYQSNTYAFFLTMSIAEMGDIMAAMGIGKTALFGPAGLGDLIATCGSKASRNYTIGFRLARGEKLTAILSQAKEVSEGVQTVKVIHRAMQSCGKQAPITATIYRILFEGCSLDCLYKSLMLI